MALFANISINILTRKREHPNVSRQADKLTFLAGSIWEAPCHVLCFGFFSMNLSRNAPSERSASGLPLYAILTPERRVLAIAATEGCTCEASTISSHQPTLSALLLLMKISKHNSKNASEKMTNPVVIK